VLGPGARRAGTWGLAVAGALLLLAAVEASTAPGAGGTRANRDAVRVLLAVPCLAGALVARRAGARPESVGFAVATAALLAAAAVDRLGTSWIVDGLDGAARLRREAIVRILSPAIVLGLPAAAGAVAMRIPFVDLWLGRRPVGWAIVLGAALGLLCFPLVNAANVFGNAALREAMSSGVASGPRGWPPLASAFERELFPAAAATRATALAARLGVAFPLLEACLHGVLRQALSRWGVLPFAVGTAFLAPLLLMDVQMAFGIFGGTLVTGLLAARTASVLPGIAFWSALVLGQVLWLGA
jgi:hypothetical protein